MGRFDLIFEATGASTRSLRKHGRPLGKNGVLVLSSVTGGDKRIEVPADRINLEFVLGKQGDGRHGKCKTVSISRWV